MKPMYIVAAALAASSLWVVASESVSKLPAPWFVSGERPSSYVAGVDHAETVSGKGAKFLRYGAGADDSWASMMQSVSAEHYRGRRLRFQAMIKTRDVSNWAGLWMRVDSDSRYSASFYNSQNRPLKGSQDWQLRSVVLDVPQDAHTVSFGLINAGGGTVWIDQLSMETVGSDVPVDVMPERNLPALPVL